MEQNNFFHPQDSYETGSTRPPKSRGGLIALLLVVMILLFGISSLQKGLC